MGWACAIGAGVVNWKDWDGEHGRMMVALVHVAFGIGLRAHVGGSWFRRVRRALVHVRQRHCVLLVDVAFEFRLQTRPLIVRKRQGYQSLRLAHKFVNITLTCHLKYDIYVSYQCKKKVVLY